MKGCHKILVIEDNTIAARVAKLILESKGYSVDCVTSGEAALKKLDVPYQLILLDLGLPGIDGFEVAKFIRNQPNENNGTPIVAVTAHEEKSIREQARQVGINDFLVKPLTTSKCDWLLNQSTSS